MAEYIERQAAFNAILKLAPKVDGDGYCWVIRGDAAAAIDAIPAADVRPVVRGKWEWDGGEDMHYYCSCCHYNAYGCTCEILDGKYSFCPNCGAMMEES